MKNIFITTFLLLAFCFCHAQNRKVDSLLAQIDKTANPVKIVDISHKLVMMSRGSIALLNKGRQDLVKAEATGTLKDRERALLLITSGTFNLRYAPELLDASLQGVRVSNEMKDSLYLERFLRYAGLANLFQQDSRKAATYFLAATKVAKAIRDSASLMANYSHLESSYAIRNLSDSAIFFSRLEMKIATRRDAALNYDYLRTANVDYGEALLSANKPDSALLYYRRAYQITKHNLKTFNTSYMANNMAVAYLKIEKLDSAVRYAQEAYQEASKTNYWEFKANAAGTLAQAYEGNNDKKSLFYLKAQMTAKDSINAAEKERQFTMIAERDHQEEQDLTANREKFEAKIRLYVVIAAALVLLVIGLILWRNNLKQKQTNNLLSEQKEEIVAQRDNLGQTLTELKSTQTQLIQSEKMASLGELTAGIAHEIQNPLNFVNNFSDVNREMIDELKEELKNGNIDDALAIADDIQQNEEKINHHGKRADGIVKGMLQHSRASNNTKEPTDVNKLADEYLRLAYHGLRAKDKSFNAELVTNFDKKLPDINMVPQDVGRVLLNLLTNAFYSVQQKQKIAGGDYKPTVEISTSLTKQGGCEIIVKDNGTGIPESIKEKIMQPFFTTKPTGEGTGLGLSMSYDIIIKGHGGTINVATTEGEYSQFTITIPVNA